MLAVYDSIQFNHSSPDNNPSRLSLGNSNGLSRSLDSRKKYQCTKCEKGFSRPSALQTHMYTHTKEKPFKCDVHGCDRSFSVVSNLRRHFKVHRKHSNGDKLSPEDRMRCVRRHIKEVEALLASTQEQQQQSVMINNNYVDDVGTSSSNSSVSSICTSSSFSSNSGNSASSISSSSSSSSSTSTSIHSLTNLSAYPTGQRMCFLGEPIHDEFDFPFLSPILYIEAPPNRFKADVLEPCSSL